MFSTEYSSYIVNHQAYQRKFPTKLWKLINSSEYKSEEGKAIIWCRDGDSIMINVEEFESQYLNNNVRPVFKAGQLSSFVRQLNLYGFKKHGYQRFPMGMRNKNAGLIIYSHPNFKRNRPDLLKHISRKAASAVREEAKVLKATKMMEMSVLSKTKLKTDIVGLSQKLCETSPSLQNARNKLNEVLDKHFSALLETFNENVSSLPEDPHADIDHIGAEEIIGKLQYLNRHSCCFECEFI